MWLLWTCILVKETRKRIMITDDILKYTNDVKPRGKFIHDM